MSKQTCYVRGEGPLWAQRRKRAVESVNAELIAALKEANGNILAGRGTWAVACIDAALRKAGAL